jgi:hypothetical protein
MGLNIGDLLRASLLFVNAIAVLNEQRFLNKSVHLFCLLFFFFVDDLMKIFLPCAVGWTSDIAMTAPNSMKARLISLTSAVSMVMRGLFAIYPSFCAYSQVQFYAGPLIILNTMMIVFELLFG